MPNAYTTKLVEKKEIAEGTTAFYFEKPEGLDFIAGQYLNWRLIDPPETDDEGTRRFFSIIFAPFEEYIGFATRMRDTAFKRIIKNMNPGDSINIFGPTGTLVLPETPERPVAFLSGGIGITPFYSMIKQASHTTSPQKIFLFYSNRRPEDTVFLKELQELASQNPNFKLIATMTEMEKSTQPWEGEKGVITADMVKKYIPNLSEPIYYSAGPPGMVEAMHKLLLEAGIADENIKTEDFTGY